MSNVITVKNIEVNDNEGDLFAHFDVHIDGKDEPVSTGEWIDLDTGLINYGPDSNFYCNHNESDFASLEDEFDEDESPFNRIFDSVNDYLSVNPISEETLQAYRDARDGYEGEKASDEEQQEVEFDVEIAGVTYSVSSSNETAYVNGEDVVWFHLEDEHRHLGEKHVLAKDVEYHGYEAAVTERIREIYQPDTSMAYK